MSQPVINEIEGRVSAHILQRSQGALCLAAVLSHSQNVFQDRLTWVHGPIELVVHAPPEPWKHRCTPTYRCYFYGKKSKEQQRG